VLDALESRHHKAAVFVCGKHVTGVDGARTSPIGRPNCLLRLRQSIDNADFD
jgi:hypothetical protein